MPEISRFFGMVVAIYYRDHSPPHFHVKYGNFRASIAIESLSLLEGKLPRRALTLVVEWALEHRTELVDNWKRAATGRCLKKIRPLH